MFATLRSDSTASASSLAPAAPAPLPTAAPLVRAVKAKRLGGARKKPVKVAKRLGGARKKPVKAAKKAVVKPTMRRVCSCIMCDGKPRRVAGEDKPCSCFMCWRNGADGTTTGSGISTRKPFVMRRDCSCVVCGGRSKNCSCVMCGGTARPKRVVAKATKKSYEKYPSKVVSKQKKPRETVPEGRFAFRDFRWSSWKGGS